MNDTAHSHDLRRLAGEREWFGYLTLENAAAVGERIRKLLDGRRYTWVACDEMGGYRPEVRAGQRMRTLTVGRYGDGKFAGVSVAETWGVWGIHTDIEDQPAAHKCEDRKRLTYLRFNRDRWGERLEIDHYAISGNHLWWTVAVEPDPLPAADEMITAVREAWNQDLTGPAETAVDVVQARIAVETILRLKDDDR